MKVFSSKLIALEVGVSLDRKIACTRIRASFGPEMFQAGAVKGLMLLYVHRDRRD